MCSSDLDAMQPQTKTVKPDGTVLVDGVVREKGKPETDLRTIGHIASLPDDYEEGSSVSLFGFFDVLHDSEVILWSSEESTLDDGSKVTTYTPKKTAGSELLRPGNHPSFKGIRSDKIRDKLNFLSLMLALFCGTASLPHILIRYYTVKDQASARKSTIVGITCIGFFYVLTLYMGLGAMTSGSMDITNSNMAAPLLAKSFSGSLFAIISAIAFTTVLGTVSGLIIASSGAVVHDLMSSVLNIEMSDEGKVRSAKIASIVVGVIATILGILFEKRNVR